MASYDIPQYPTKRLRYFNNQFLNEQDFIDDQAYQIAHERAQMRALCVAGVCEGLAVSYPAVNKPPSVGSGVAIDSSGRLIVLDVATDGPAPGTLGDDDYSLYIGFFEEPTNMAPPAAGGAQDNTRWHSKPQIAAVKKSAALPAGAVVLGSFSVKTGAIVGAGGTSAGRQYSGLRLPGPNATTTATLVNRNDGSADGAVFTGALTIRRDTGGGQLGPVLSFVNGNAYPGGANAGAAIDFSGYDPGTAAPALRIQSLGDGAGSSHLAFLTKAPGANANALVERLRISSDGLLRFSNEAPKDKIVVWETGPTDRYGIGHNNGNLNLFYPAGARFSLRVDNTNGAEVFRVTGAGDAFLTGKLAVGGVVSWGESDTRTESRNDAGLQGNAGARSGFYQANAPVNFPSGAGGWWHLLDVRHSNPTNNYALQLAGGFFDQNLWFRKTNNSAATAWNLVIAADPSGNATIGGKLTVTALTLPRTRWETYGTDGTILTDNVTYKALMIVGSDQGQGHARWVRMWDDVQVERSLNILSGDLFINSRLAVRGTDPWLRLNQDGAFTGVYTPGLFRTDGDIQLGGKHAFRGNDAWLRLNQDGAFVGVHTPGKLAPNSLNVGGAGPSSWDTNPSPGCAWFAGRIGTQEWNPEGGGHFPANWGGGVHTWDVVAEATVGYSATKQWSSIQEKTNLTPVENALATLEQLNPTMYDRGGNSWMGFVAEEVREVFAHGAEARDEDFFAIAVQPDSLLALAIAAIQELSTRVKQLAPAPRRVAARATSIDEPSAPIEVLREATKGKDSYVTARFRLDHDALGLKEVVRTIRIPPDQKRDACLAAEYDAWRDRVGK